MWRRKKDERDLILAHRSTSVSKGDVCEKSRYCTSRGNVALGRNIPSAGTGERERARLLFLPIFFSFLPFPAWYVFRVIRRREMRTARAVGVSPAPRTTHTRALSVNNSIIFEIVMFTTYNCNLLLQFQVFDNVSRKDVTRFVPSTEISYFTLLSLSHTGTHTFLTHSSSSFLSSTSLCLG